MNKIDAELLYNLLPTVYRARDIAEGEPLRALFGVIESELRVIEDDIDGLYDNFFIETCQEWVVPYIGDLLGVRGLHPGSPGIFSQRAYVGNTTAYRRRKGTATTLEQVAHDTTGWAARVVEFYSLLSSTQHMNHPRLSNVRSPDLRNTNQMELLGGPFEKTPRTVDVRSISQNRGKYNIPNIGIYLWRLQSYPINKAQASIVDSNHGRFRFSQLGTDMTLFNNPITETEVTHLAEEENVPGQLRLRSLYEDLESYRKEIETNKTAQATWFSKNKPAFRVFYRADSSADYTEVQPEDIAIKNLNGWPPISFYKEDKQNSDEIFTAVVDPVLGRIALNVSLKEVTDVAVSYSYGFSADIGGGSYDRRHTLMNTQRAAYIAKTGDLAYPKNWDGETFLILVKKGNEQGADRFLDAHSVKKTIQEAKRKLVDIWKKNKGSKTTVVIRIMDSSTYCEKIDIKIPGKCTLAIEAANETRPYLSFRNSDGITLSSLGDESKILINGFLISGGITVVENETTIIENEVEVFKKGTLDLTLKHSTLVPGWTLAENGTKVHPSLDSISTSELSEYLSVKLDHCITGSLRLPDELCSLTINDSIIDPPIVTKTQNSENSGGDANEKYGPPRTDNIYSDVNKSVLVKRPAITGNESCDPGPRTTIIRSTVLGPVYLRELELASEVIFTHKVEVERTQIGNVRYSYVPEGSKVPRRFRCQPDLALKSLDDPDKKELVRLKVKPVFTSREYGHPGFAQLVRSCADEIRTGAEDGSEMGVFSHLKQPQREANLRTSIDEYLRFGLEAEIFFVT